MKSISSLLLAAILFSSCGENSSATEQQNSSQAETSAPAEQAISVSAVKLYKDYEANEVAADNVYKGKTIEVTGKVASINKDIMDDVYVQLETGEEFGLSHIDCHLSEPGSAAQLKKGQTVTIMGTGDMMIIGSPQLRGCTIK